LKLNYKPMDIIDYLINKSDTERISERLANRNGDTDQQQYHYTRLKLLNELIEEINKK